jgi:predicted RecA/RadA family phage recombinase
MMNFVQPGNSVTFPAPANVTSGDLVFVGAAFGVAAETAASGDLVDLWTEGVFTLPKAADVIAVGALVYWNAGTKLVTTTVGSNAKIGVATIAAGASDGTVAVRLNGSF